MIDAIHVSDRAKNMLGFPSLAEARAAVERRGYIVETHDDGSMIWDDFPVSNPHKKTLQFPGIPLTLLLSRNA